MTVATQLSISSSATYIQRETGALRESASADNTSTSLRQLTQQTAKSLVNNVSTSTLSQTAAMISDPATEPANDSVRVSTTIGKAASSGRLTKEEALAIYQKIAAYL